MSAELRRTRYRLSIPRMSVGLCHWCGLIQSVTGYREDRAVRSRFTSVFVWQQLRIVSLCDWCGHNAAEIPPGFFLQFSNGAYA